MPYQQSSDIMNGYPHQPKTKHSGSGRSNGDHSSTSAPRSNIKSKSHLQAKAQWKDKLRRGCLERAKNARRERLRTSRRLHSADHGGAGPSNGRWGEIVSDGSDSTHGCSTTSDRRDGIFNTKRDRENAYPEWNISEFDADGVILDHAPVEYGCRPSVPNGGETYDGVDVKLKHSESGDSEENVVDTARSLVEQELQHALAGLQHCRQVCPVDGGIPLKKTHHNEHVTAVRDVEIMDSDLAEVREKEEEKQIIEDEYKISHMEFVDLLNDVTEELQREDELLEEELWEMERADAMERERLMHQIDDFDSWEELEQQQQQHSQHLNTYISPLANLNSPLVTCPICNTSSLMETPHGGIKCTDASATTPNKCTFQLDIAHEGLTLNHLQDQLRAVYEEHSRVCSRGVLQFRVEKRGGMGMLMAKCDVCSSDVVVL